MKRPPLHRLAKYGLTPEDWASLLAIEGYRCPCCLKPFGPTRAPHTDHSHASYETRGLLCLHCNQLIAALHDDPDFARRLADFLEHPPAAQLPGPRRRARDAPPV